jgi:PilZ domain
MSGVRRSGRIPKQIPIVLVGTDTSGRVFSEETNTVLLSQHGAGIRSRNKFAPDEVMTIRIADTNREAEVRLVGSMGANAYGTIYGVAFRDENLDFWQMEFPPVSSPTPDNPETILECSLCRQQQAVRQTDVEADVYAINEMILRYCGVCGSTTHWRLAKETEAPQPARKIPAARPHEVAPSVPPPAERAATPAPRNQPAPAHSFYGGGGDLELVAAHLAVAPQGGATGAGTHAASLPAAEPGKAPAGAPQSVPSPQKGSGAQGKANQRAHVRTRVTFTACIRQGVAEELVECENVSRGGFCFHSRKRYGEETLIDAALPYSLGQQALFVPAAIKRVEELPAAGLFRYGCAYVKPVRR